VNPNCLRVFGQKGVAALVCLFSLAWLTTSEAKPIDCSVATRAIDRAICGDQSLVAGDDLLSSMHDTLVEEVFVPAVVIKNQKKWLKLRDQCVSGAGRKTPISPSSIKCLKDLYSMRTDEYRNLHKGLYGKLENILPIDFEAWLHPLCLKRVVDGDTGAIRIESCKVAALLERGSKRKFRASNRDYVTVAVPVGASGGTGGDYVSFSVTRSWTRRIGLKHPGPEYPLYASFRYDQKINGKTDSWLLTFGLEDAPGGTFLNLVEKLPASNDECKEPEPAVIHGLTVQPPKYSYYFFQYGSAEALMDFGGWKQSETKAPTVGGAECLARFGVSRYPKIPQGEKAEKDELVFGVFFYPTDVEKFKPRNGGEKCLKDELLASDVTSFAEAEAGYGIRPEEWKSLVLRAQMRCRVQGR
jgi:uncharacterized protein YecT (DUF1311 family)